MTAYRVIERAYDTALIARLAPELVTVALANVNDATPVRDVITLFLTDKWQDAVGEIARRAAVTVVVLGEFTEGLAAELRMLHEAQLHGRVVLLMHKTDPRWYGLGLLDQFANQFDYADGVQAHAVASQIKRLTGLGKADGAITKQSGNA